MKKILLTALTAVLLTASASSFADTLEVESINGDVVTLSDGTEVQAYDMDGISVGSTVESSATIDGKEVSDETADSAENDGIDVNKTYTFENSSDGEEY